MFRNTLTANDKYAVWDCENLSCPIQMQLSSKPKGFSDFFVLYLGFTSNVEHFDKKDDRKSCFISQTTDCQRLG